MSSSDHRLSAEAVKFYAEVYPAARAGCVNELRGVGCSEEEAEDLFAAVNAKVMDRVDPVARHFEPPQMVNLLKKACRRLLIDRHRHDEVLGLMELTEADFLSEAGVEEAAEDHEAIAMYREAVRSLGKRERQVLLLSFQGFSPEEIQQLMPELSRRSYRNAIERARKRARTTLEGIEDGRLCKEVERVLPLYLRGTASEGQGRQVRAHLERCPACQQTCAQMRGRMH
jgi:RNA polymerase sigma factor (sigma-70 family)